MDSVDKPNRIIWNNPRSLFGSFGINVKESVQSWIASRVSLSLGMVHRCLASFMDILQFATCVISKFKPLWNSYEPGFVLHRSYTLPRHYLHSCTWPIFMSLKKNCYFIVVHLSCSLSGFIRLILICSCVLSFCSSHDLGSHITIHIPRCCYLLLQKALKGEYCIMKGIVSF